MHINPIQLFDAESSTFTYILATANATWRTCAGSAWN